MGSVAEREWWRDAVVYQVYVRSFADANGDGKGDLQGIIDHLPYLEALGVDAIWMCPCFPSPQMDHGYDVADYMNIEPTYGTLADFDRLVAAGRQHGIRIMLDIVPNHCSSQHQWFIDAVAAGRGSRERDRFWFRDGKGPNGDLPPNNWTAIFGGPAWTRVTEPDGTPGQWYLHVFTPWQPDWNWENEDVKAHFDRTLTFWFDRGVEGFRVDAVGVAGKADGLPDQVFPEGDGLKATENAGANVHIQFQPRAHDYWRRWRRVIDAYQAEHPGRSLVTVSEAYTPGKPELLLEFVKPDQFHQSFNFDLMLAPWLAGPIRQSVAEVYEVLTDAGTSVTWTLNNHDTQRAVTRYGRANAASLESWTKNNLVYVDAPVDLELGARRNDAMIAFAAALPGSFYLYQGEELGLPEVLDLPADRREDPLFIRTNGEEIGRDGCRVPLPWTTDAATSFGFSPVQHGEPWLPQPSDWGRYAASSQEADASSSLAHYRHVFAHRRALDVLAPLEWLLSSSDELVAFRRGAVVVVLNVSDHEVSLPAEIAVGRTVIISSVRDHTDPAVVPANSCLWLLAR